MPTPRLCRPGLASFVNATLEAVVLDGCEATFSAPSCPFLFPNEENGEWFRWVLQPPADMHAVSIVGQYGAANGDKSGWRRVLWGVEPATLASGIRGCSPVTRTILPITRGSSCRSRSYMGRFPMCVGSPGFVDGHPADHSRLFLPSA